ncbi:hypothetical protein HDU79_004360 [Rhizoclosmatium sp. JEL0117]|nr:hypothetical protein HDU79_004360 [Rhizoclosmatium sp. JEL0117]
MSSSTEEDEFSDIHTSELKRLMDDNERLKKDVRRLNAQVDHLDSVQTELSTSQTKLVIKTVSLNNKLKDAEAGAQTLQQQLESA